MAVTAVEAATMPDSIFADHLFGSVDVVAAAGASFTFRCLQAQFLGQRCIGVGAIDGDQSGRVAVTETFGSELFSVASPAVDFFVGSVASQHRIQRSFTVEAVEAQFMVFAAFRQRLLGGEDYSSATGTALTFLRFDGPRVDVDERRLLASRDGVTLKEGRAATESIAFGSVLLGVAKFAVDVVIGSIASQHRVQDTVALFAVEARLVPDCSACQHLLCGEDRSSASGTSVLTFDCFDERQVGSAGSHLLSITSMVHGEAVTETKTKELQLNRRLKAVEFPCYRRFTRMHADMLIGLLN